MLSPTGGGTRGAPRFSSDLSSGGNDFATSSWLLSQEAEEWRAIHAANAYVANNGNNTIGKFSPAGTDLGHFRHRLARSYLRHFHSRARQRRPARPRRAAARRPPPPASVKQLAISRPSSPESSAFSNGTWKTGLWRNCACFFTANPSTPLPSKTRCYPTPRRVARIAAARWSNAKPVAATAGAQTFGAVRPSRRAGHADDFLERRHAKAWPHDSPPNVFLAK